ncbi:DNA polymerase III subunit alpha [Tenuibacillus multivorans]|uniref:DNA polymerase III subunit alpha n=1 Tax=Tenuibacillus multivorans TaxID=237069 RepID=A0A1G9ZVI1_9BACI|nr:DNA polymerase III subunit alpha [Tenuibacillus multivorans]GEL76858.1 DNA polymerase III subunit alpha [Tenuibacillus multivorans]SDN24951.1 DNA polymerase-3 subunit alpha [Tenuibacillus multivorans]
MSFVHLQVKSSYTYLNSTIDIDSYVEQVRQLGFSACAITDHESMHGVYSFYQVCRKVGVKPIIGMSMNVYIGSEKRPVTIYLYAKNEQGYRSLVQLSNLKKLDHEKITVEKIGQYEGVLPIISFYDTYIEDIIYLDDQAHIKELFHNIDQHLPEWYFSVEPITSRRNVVTDWLDANSPYYAEKMVFMCDVRYLNESDRIGYESMYAMDQSSSLDAVRRQAISGIHLLSEKEVDERLPQEWHEAKERTQSIADQCDVSLPEKWFSLPEYPDTEGQSSESYLRALCEMKLPKRYTQQDLQLAQQRLDHELDVIESMDFSDYFLIVWDIVRYAKQENILVGPGRGSASGSIVAYLLGIIEIDPLKYDLLFERFLNPERRNMPDIDIDFSDYRRDEVIQYVSRKYGQDRVAQIITFGTFQARSTVRELAKVFQIEKGQLTYLLKQLNVKASSLRQIVQENHEFRDYIKESERLKSMFQAASIIEGLPRHYSTHAAGIVISNQPLTQKIPVLEGQDLITLTQFPMQQLEAVGLLKMDLLGLRNLTLLERMVKQIEENEGKKINLNGLPLNDSKTYQLLRNGFTTGVFQLESDGMKRALKLIKPNEIEDIVAVNALFRPGPMQFIETFAKRKHGREELDYIHEDLEPILNNTYGVLVYQEQIMQAVHKLAGFSYGQADILRRAISKKNRDVIHQMKERFIDGCLQNGYDERIANQMFDWIERFSDYGFNKSHAAAYSIISYQTAYFKANYPAYFYSELMSSVMHDHEKLERYIKEARAQGIQVLPPSINNSFGKFTVESPNQIRFGLLAIKGVGKQAYDDMFNARKQEPFKNIFDFCKRVSLKVVNQSVIETLIMAGAFDETKRHRAQLLASVMPSMEQGELFSDIDGQINWTDDLFEMDIEYPNAQPFPVMKQLNMERDVIGFVISEHPLSHIRRALRKEGYLSIKEILSKHLKQCSMVVSVDRIKHVRTKRGEQMAFLTLQDETNEIEGVLFPKLHRDVHRWLDEGQFVKIRGKLDQRNGKYQVILNEMDRFSIDSVSKTNQAKIFIRAEEGNEEKQLKELYNFCQRHPGNTPIVYHVPSQHKTYQLSEAYDVSYTKEVLEQLKGKFQPENVKVKTLQP